MKLDEYNWKLPVFRPASDRSAPLDRHKKALRIRQVFVKCAKAVPDCCELIANVLASCLIIECSVLIQYLFDFNTPIQCIKEKFLFQIPEKKRRSIPAVTMRRRGFCCKYNLTRYIKKARIEIQAALKSNILWKTSLKIIFSNRFSKFSPQQIWQALCWMSLDLETTLMCCSWLNKYPLFFFGCKF